MVLVYPSRCLELKRILQRYEKVLTALYLKRCALSRIMRGGDVTGTLRLVSIIKYCSFLSQGVAMTNGVYRQVLTAAGL